MKVVGASSKTPAMLLDLLAPISFVTAKLAAEQLEGALTTAQRATKKLQDVAILEEIGDAQRDRVYCAREILEVLEEPARLTPA